jgi:ferredoxin-NADP reductase/Na+-translocating ferredoxin:NAD+ oxidoreductase RnfD subunit
MYRLVLYYLIVLIAVAVIESFLGIIQYKPDAILFSTAFLLAASYITNKIFSYVFEAPTNVESVYITALILALIIQPSTNIHTIPFLFWASVLSMASKYIFAFRRKHIFNPAAVAVALTSFGFFASANWWVGATALVPFVAVGGFLIVKKIRRWDLVLSYYAAAAITMSVFVLINGGDVIGTIQKSILHSSLFFLAFTMLTEPLTTPPTRGKRILYGALVGILYTPQFHILSWYTTPEIGLLIGNVFSFLVSPKEKLKLYVKEKILIAKDMYDFLFVPNQKVAYSAGQYMEWTLQHPQTDSRGNRRYFTVSSSPTENTLRLGIKFNNPGSSFKKYMLSMSDKAPIIAAQLSGDFTLPDDAAKKLVFLGGGIGITPFRSMIKYLVDTNQKRDIVLFYSNKDVSEIVYKDVFDDAEKKLGIKTVYTLTDKEHIPSNWKGNVGRVDEKMITQMLPDYKERIYYISGPHAMVTGYETLLQQLGIPLGQIVIDYFPGFV